MKRLVVISIILLGMLNVAYAAGPPVTVTKTTPLATQTNFDTAATVAYRLTSNLPFSIPDLTLTPSAVGGTFTRTGGTCSNVLAAGGSCTWQGEFTPTRVNTNSATLTLKYGGQGTYPDTQTTTTVEGPDSFFGYVLDVGLGRVFRCVVDKNTGAFADCENANATGLSLPEDIVLNSTDTVAFIASEDNNLIVRCNINATTGKFDSCVPARAADACDGVANSLICEPRSIALHNNFAYIYMNSNNATNQIPVVRCTINDDNDLTGCVEEANYTPQNPNNLGVAPTIRVNPQGTRIYSSNALQRVAGDNSVVVTFGSINAGTGAIENSFNIFKDEVSLGEALTTSGLAFNTNGTRLYIMRDTNNGNVGFVCDIDPNSGNVQGCIPVNQNLNPHAEIVLNAAGTRAFVSTHTEIYNCTIRNQDGTFNSCDEEDNVGVTFNSISRIALQSDV